ncbi:MAG: TonB-dependent receptor [Gemmatimonadaceae bacterium]
MHTLRARWSWNGVHLLGLLAAPALAQGTITGTVLGTDNRPVDAASVSAIRSDRSIAREAVTDARGTFRLAQLSPGVYTVTARKLGYRSAELPGIRLAEGQALSLNVTLTQAPRQLSTIQVVTSPTSIDASTPELSVRLDRYVTELLPSARTASSLIALVPGARKDQLWGGAPGVSNNYQLDGVAVNHPGIGGDFLALSVDWIESLDVRGLGAGAEHGNFQGGIINAITKTGSNERRYAIRTNYESPQLTASNFNLGEQGVEQAGRRELAGEALGPLARDRLFYFVAGQYVRRDLRSPNLATSAPRDFQQLREEQTDARALAKLTWLPALGQRVDLLAGYSAFGIEHAGINGIDDPTGMPRVSRPTTFHGLTWNNTRSSRNQFHLRVAGFNASESRSGYEGPGVPGVHVLQAGRQPRYQNAGFNELREPRSISASAEWRSTQRLWTEHQLVIGGEGMRGWWRDERIRNAGLTWRPYPTDSITFDPLDATTWGTVASEWGGEIRLNSDVASEAVYVQDRLALGSRVTLAPGIRYGHWSGYVRPHCDPPVGRAGCRRFEAVSAEGFDPRIGIAWDVTGRNTFVVKAHWGRYHQGMHALFFDRAAGANVYSNQSLYHAAPPLTRSDATFTPAQRDAPGSGFDPFPSVSVLDASGRVDGYRQPYVDQSVFAIEKSFGASWKAEVVYTRRMNGDIVGLVDRNLFANYTLLADVGVDHRYVSGLVLDAHGNRLVLPFVYVANIALRDYLAELNGRRQFPPTLFGYPADYIRALQWNPDVVLSAVPEAKRRYEQATVMLRTVQPNWRADGSITGARLRGNVPGVTGYGTTATRFSAGPFVNPNEAINSYGNLPDALLMEGKVWLTARLPYSMQGGLLYTHTIGERFTPSFQVEGRYVYRWRALTPIPDKLFGHSFGQSILLEPRGSRHFASRALVDAHLEWRSPRRAVLTLDLFNVFGENELVGIKTTVEDQFPSDPTTLFGAPRLRVSPRTLRVGLRVD